MTFSLKRASMLAAALMMAAGLAACGSSSKKSTTNTTAAQGTTTTVAVSATSCTNDFSVMGQLKSIASQGKGLIGVLLPDTTTSTRYVAYDAPYLKKAFEAAGLTDSEFKIDNAQGSAATMQTQAEADITAGATVLLVDALDSGSGATHGPSFPKPLHPLAQCPRTRPISYAQVPHELLPAHVASCRGC